MRSRAMATVLMLVAVFALLHRAWPAGIVVGLGFIGLVVWRTQYHRRRA